MSALCLSSHMDRMHHTYTPRTAYFKAHVRARCTAPNRAGIEAVNAAFGNHAGPLQRSLPAVHFSKGPHTCPCCGLCAPTQCSTSSSYTYITNARRGRKQLCVSRAAGVETPIASEAKEQDHAEMSFAGMNEALSQDNVNDTAQQQAAVPHETSSQEAATNASKLRRQEGHSGNTSSTPSVAVSRAASFSFPATERNHIKESWDTLMRWSRVFRTRKIISCPIEATTKVAVFGGGSFGTAMGVALALQKKDLEVVLLVRDPQLCTDINVLHRNTRYLKDFILPPNVRATTSAADAISGAQYAVHAVPVQSSRAFLHSISDLLPSTVPIICVSKGLEVGSGGLMMSELIPSALGRKQPAVFLSGPSFAKEVMESRPTGVVAACKDLELGRTVQQLFASQSMRVNTTTDVVGVEICGALKNVLAIAAGIVEGLDLGHNALAALISQGCAEIRWLAEKMGAKPTTISGLSGLGDIMLTCYGSLSRNRSVGVRLGQGEKLADILASSPQVAEGVATAGVVVGLARKYRVSLPVLTAVAQVLDNNLTPSEAVYHIMNLPQIEES